MRVLVLHNHVSADMSPSDRDVLDQRDAVLDALGRLGHEADTFATTLDLSQVAACLARQHPDVVFNLVESLSGTDRLMPAVPLLLDALGVPYTGVPTGPMLVSTGKLSAKQWLQRGDLPTAPWFAAVADGWQGLPDGDSDMQRDQPGSWTARLSPLIVKAIWEHASFHLDDTALVQLATDQELARLLAARRAKTGQPHFAEPYLEGREFNLSLLADDTGPQVLPPAEIDFADFPADKPRIVGYRAKWDDSAFEYHHTPRRFDFPHSDTELLRRLVDLASACWEHFALRGYARVDFRVGGDGRPWILEVNANPCLARDAGFAAALDRAGIAYEAAVDRLLHDALRGTVATESGEPV